MNLLGHVFRKMEAQDFVGFAGAEDGDWIASSADTDTILIAHSGDDGWEVHEITDETEHLWVLKDGEPR